MPEQGQLGDLGPGGDLLGGRGLCLSEYRFPTGWFIVGFSSDLAPGEVKRIHYFGEELPYFCVPRYVEVLDELPKNAIGRVRKDLLRSRGLTPAAWDREAHGYIVTR